MGHDISGFNKQDRKIAYVRYGSWNKNVDRLYQLFDSEELNGSISGICADKTFTYERMKEIKMKFDAINWTVVENAEHERKKLGDFVEGCLKAAFEDGEVRISFD